MRTSVLSDASVILAAVGKLFDEKAPVLVEVRFPKMGTSSDWFLCEDAAALGAILDRLGPGVEVHLSSVWDLKNPAGAVVIQPPLSITAEEREQAAATLGESLRGK
jgi:hypothetical protein